jgi:hypothetical protein
MKSIIILISFILFSSPAMSGDLPGDDSDLDVTSKPVPSRFSVCYNYSCSQRATIGISDSDWKKVRALFRPKAKNAVEERRRIAQSIALVEKIVAPIIGTQNDRGYNFKNALADGNQHDCIDESTNTTTYLTMMQHDNLFRFHTVQNPSTRGWFIMGLPHTTAVIRDTDSGVDFAVDSWFHDNGVEPEILPLDRWWKGWDPNKDKTGRQPANK